MIRLFLSLSFLVPSLIVSACSCVNYYTPLADVLCELDATGGQLLEVTLLRKGDYNSGTFRIEKVHFGSTNRQEIELGARHSCARWINDEPIGQRFLYLSGFRPDGEVDGDLFECGFNSNLYRMNRSGTEVEYPFPDRSTPARNAGMRFQGIYSALNGLNCDEPDLDEEELLARLPLIGLRLTNNPGNGQIGIFNTKGPLPPIEQVDIFDAAARHVATFPITEESPLGPLDVSLLPRGIYYVFIRDARTRKMLPYVKSL